MLIPDPSARPAPSTVDYLMAGALFAPPEDMDDLAFQDACLAYFDVLLDEWKSPEDAEAFDGP